MDHGARLHARVPPTQIRSRRPPAPSPPQGEGAAVVRLRAYHIIAEAVEQGIAYGYRRGHKHTDAPSEDELCSAIYEAVMSELCDVVDFDAPSLEKQDLDG